MRVNLIYVAATGVLSSALAAEAEVPLDIVAPSSVTQPQPPFASVELRDLEVRKGGKGGGKGRSGGGGGSSAGFALSVPGGIVPLSLVSGLAIFSSTALLV